MLAVVGLGGVMALNGGAVPTTTAGTGSVATATGASTTDLRSSAASPAVAAMPAPAATTSSHGS